MKKITSGIYGLNPLMDSGINVNSTTVVIGASGAGKTTFATQFLRRGLEDGQEGIFVSLDENKEQIIREAVEMGWPEVLDYLEEEQLVFIDASGKDFSDFIQKELPSFVNEYKGADARIVIDPLTPVLWAIEERYRQRDIVGFMLKETRKVGTVLCTLEEHSTLGDLSGPETIIPMYLADNVIHLRYVSTGPAVSRTMKIIKARSTRHSENEHFYQIMKGLGIVVRTGETREETGNEVPEKIKEILREYAGRIPQSVYRRLHRALNELVDSDFQGFTEDEVVQYILTEYPPIEKGE